MNAAIIQKIETKTNSTVTYENIGNGITRYFLTKPVNGRTATVFLDTNASMHADNDADQVSDIIAAQAAQSFKQLREKSTTAPLDKAQ